MTLLENNDSSLVSLKPMYLVELVGGKPKIQWTIKVAVVEIICVRYWRLLQLTISSLGLGIGVSFLWNGFIRRWSKCWLGSLIAGTQRQFMIVYGYGFASSKWLYSKVSHITSAQKKSFHLYTLELVHGSLKNDFGQTKTGLPGLQSEGCRFVEIPHGLRSDFGEDFF